MTQNGIKIRSDDIECVDGTMFLKNDCGRESRWVRVEECIDRFVEKAINRIRCEN